MASVDLGDRLAEEVERKQSAVCAGLDPRAALLPPELVEDPEDPESLARSFALFGNRICGLLAPHVAAVKPQAAFFEELGAPGMAALEEVCRTAHGLGLLVIADVKRGDIGTTAEAYARAWLGVRQGGAPLADACTVSPYLGSDGLRPFLDVAAPHGGGIFVLVRTSNPSSGELQELECSGEPLYVHVARLVAELEADRAGSSSYGRVGAVAGGTHPEDLARVRKLLPQAFLLVPGYGAQGANAKDVAPAFDSRGNGALVAASRSLTFPWAASQSKGSPCPPDWEEQVVHAAVEMKRELERVRTRDRP